MFCGHKAQPGRHVSSLAELAAIPCCRNECGCAKGTNPRDGQQPADRLALVGNCFDRGAQGFDSLLNLGKIIQVFVQQCPHVLGQIVLHVAKVPPDIGMKGTSPNPHHQPVFNTKGPCLIHQSGTFADKPVPDSMQCLKINLLSGAHFDEPHGRPVHRLDNGSRVNRVGLV